MPRGKVQAEATPVRCTDTKMAEVPVDKETLKEGHIQDELLGEAASKAIQKKYPSLKRAITDDLLDHLFSKRLLTEAVYEQCIDKATSLSAGDRGRIVLNWIRQLVKYSPGNFETFCLVLEREGHDCGNLVKEVRGFFTDECNLLSKKSSRAPLDSLKEKLDTYAKEPADLVKGVIKHCVSQYIEQRDAAGATKAEVDGEIFDICYESLLVPPNLIEEIQSLTKSMSILQKKPQEATEEGDGEEVKEKTPPQPLEPLPVLELKDVLYHSSLCCHAVTSCPDSYPDFFSKSGHNFHEISMSLEESPLERCLIAVKGDTMYVAFRSEAFLADWIDSKKGYRSFDDGLRKQSSRISYAFFLEHLEKKKKLVFTGFSFGGLLACFATAMLWKESYIPVPDLEKNVVCVTYGQPLVKVPLVEHVMQHYDHFQDTIYHVYNKEDIFPRVLRYFSCKQHDMKTLQPQTTTDTDLGDPGSLQEFSNPFPKRFLDYLVVLQREEMTYSRVMAQKKTSSSASRDALEGLRAQLDSISRAPEVDYNILPGRYCYLSSPNRKWIAFPTKEHAARMLNTLPEGYAGENFTKHNMREYIEKVRDPFFNTEPIYMKPVHTTDQIPKVKLLKPDVKEVDIHIYENEHAVVLEGENLSFCHAVQLGEMKKKKLRIDTPAQITPRMIRFNFPPTDKTRQINVQEEKVKVALHSHFAKRIEKPVKLKTENFRFSVRQIQVAKYTPAEVIQLAFMTALLERHSKGDSEHSKGASERFKTVNNFLQEAVKVVPLESVLHAITFLPQQSDALECADALLRSKIKISNSYYSQSSALLAAVRIATSLDGHNLLMLLAQPFGGYLPGLLNSVSFVDPTCTEIHFNPGPPPGSYSAAVRNTLNAPPPASPIIVVADTPHGPEYRQVTGFTSTLRTKDIPPSGKIEIARQLRRLAETKESTSDAPYCMVSIEQLYPIDSQRRHTMSLTTLESPREVLANARKELQVFLEESQDESDTQNLTNEKMLDLIRDVFDHKLKICAALLASFMESQIHIPMLKDHSSMSTANLLSSNSSPLAIGVWTLFTKTFQDLQLMLASTRGNPLLVKIADYISGVIEGGVKGPSKQNSKYDGKLQFLLQGLTKTVTSSMEYVSYSLEHQLCKHLKFDKEISVRCLVEKWDEIFKGDPLSLVAKSHRYVTARWLKWAVLIHDLRLALAQYTCIGVTGLVNSGKSQLVKKLFGVQTRVGTLEKTRTTVPLLYNLDGVVNGLDVIDFPGVDDKEHNIPKLAGMLLGLAQVVVFVCDYRRIVTDQAKLWIKELESHDIPVVVCLTFADTLYSQFIEEDDSDPNPSHFKEREIKKELELKKSRIGQHPSRVVDFYCFDVPKSYRKEINTKSLRETGIRSPLDVGDQLVKIFKEKFKQENVTENLNTHVKNLRSLSEERPVSPPTSPR